MDHQDRLKRLRYRSWHRGCKETDLILGQFSEARLEALAPEILNVYERLLDEDDADIWNWIIGKGEAPAAEYVPLLEMLKGYGVPAV